MASCGFVDYCKSAGLRQYEVARLLGVSKVTVCRWAKGKSVPQRRFVSRMSEVFGQTFSFPSRVYKRHCRPCCPLAVARYSVGVSQRALASSIGVSPNIVARWEMGNRVPSRKSRKALAGFFGYSVDSFFPKGVR